MVVAVKLSGFAPNIKTNDILKFIQPTGIKDFDLFLCMQKEGTSRNQFNGTVYVLVESQIEASSLLRLNHNNLDGLYIQITKCSILEMKNQKLFPNVKPELFELAEKEAINQLENVDSKIKQQNLMHSTFISTLVSDQKSQEQSPVPRQPPIIKNNENNLKRSSNLNYNRFIKLFYIKPHITSQDIYSFVSSTCFPCDILFSTFDNGPHAGKNRGEVFIEFSSSKEAIKCLQLSSQQLGGVKINVVLPTNEEIDTVKYQNSGDKHFDEQTASPVAKKKPVPFKDESTCTIHTFAPKSALTPTFQSHDHCHPSSLNDMDDFTSVASCTVKINNVSKNTTASDLLKFFRLYRFKQDSLKKLLEHQEFDVWEISFKSTSQAVAAFLNLNYKKLNGVPLELKLI